MSQWREKGWTYAEQTTSKLWWCSVMFSYWFSRIALFQNGHSSYHIRLQWPTCLHVFAKSCGLTRHVLQIQQFTNPTAYCKETPTNDLFDHSTLGLHVLPTNIQYVNDKCNKPAGSSFICLRAPKHSKSTSFRVRRWIGTFRNNPYKALELSL